MAIQKILQTDTLDSGFRVKYNETADSIINGNGILDANGNIKLPKEDGTFWTIDIKSYYASKADVTEMLVPAIRLATDTVTGQVRKATLSELVNGSSDFAYISSMQLLYALENISLLVDTLKIGDNLFENGLVKLLSTDGTNANTDIGISVVDNLGVESNYFKLINDTWTTDTGFKGDYLDFNTSSTALSAIGRLKWNDQDGTLDLGLKGGNVTLQIGQEQVLRVVNKTGATLNEADFRVVRIRDISEGGSQGQRLAVVLAQGNSDADSATTIGIVTETILNNQEGFITTSGNVSEINTTGAKSYGGLETWLDGDILYLDPINQGYLTKVKPQAPNHTIIVGWVVYAHANHGKIFVKVDNGYELEELHNVKITSVADKDILTWNSTTNVWENLSLTELSGVNGSGTTNYIAKWTDADTITDSIIFDNGTNVGIGTNTPFSKLILSGASGFSIFGIERSNPLANGGIGAIGFKNTDATSPYLSAITSTFGTNTTSSYLSFRLGTASSSPYSLPEIVRISLNGNFILGGTFTDLGLKFQVVGESYFSDSVGIGSTSLTSSLSIRKSLTTSKLIGVFQGGSFSESITGVGYGFRNDLLVNASLSIASYYHYFANVGTIGSGATISNQYGFIVSSTLNNATNNYGFFSNIASGSNNNWNFYASGTAPNYFAGNVGIGSTSLSSTSLRITKNIAGASTSLGVYQAGLVQADVSVAYGFRNDSQSASSIVSFTDYQHFASVQGTMNTAPTNHTGFYVANLTSGTNIYAFFGNLSSGTTKWNLYMAGTAKNYLNGSLLIGTTTDSGYKLDVTGTARFTGIVQFDSIPTTSIVPSSANHIVNKAYVDSLALVKRGDNVRTIVLPSPNGSPNGNITLSGTPTINGVSLVAGDYVLVTGQTNQTQNGVYVIPVDGGTWTRSTTNNSDAEIRGAYHYITAGTYANQRYINTNTSTINIVAGVSTTNITYAIDFGAETDPVWTAFKTENSITPTSISNWNTAYTNTTNGTFYLATNPSNYITLSSLSAGAGLSYNSATGVFSYSGTIYTDSLIRGLISGIAPISYNSTTGEISMLSATSARDGYLTKEDWATFNNKLGITSTFTLSGDVSGSGVYNSISTTVNAIKNKTIPTLATGLLRYDGTNFVFDNAYIKLTNLSSTATGLTYTNTTGVFSLTSGYSIPTTANQTNWTTAYNGSITAISISGTTSKTLTLTRQNDTPLSVSFSDLNAITSVNGSTGAVVLTTSNIAEGTNLYFTNPRVLSTTLTGYSVGANSAIASTDTILGAFAKIQGQLNAKISQNQTITITGDASGSGNTSIALTLANSGVTAGTYRSVTVDAKGRVTAGTNPTTISGYGITDFYSQTLSSFTATNSAIIAGDSLLNALQKAQGQINNSFKKTDISSNNNYLVKFASATNTLTQSLIFDTGTRIGIGTNSPTGALQINSPLNVPSTLVLKSYASSGNNILEFLDNANARTSYIGHGSTINNNLIYSLPNADSHLFYTNNLLRLTIDGSGNVGIGTSTLTYKLNVAGDINLTSGSKLRLNGSTGIDHQFIKFDGTNTVWAKLNTGELEDGDDIVKYVLDNGEKGIKLYSNDSTSTTKDTVGFIFANEDTGIIGIHGFALDSEENILEYGIQIDQDTNIYRLKSDGARARILTTDDIIAGGGSTYSFSSPLILSNNIVSIQQATSTQNGFLSANDWNSFNSKLGGNGGLIDGGNLSIRTSLLIGTSNADYAILSPSLYKLTIAQNSSSLSEIIIQSKNGTGGTVKIDTNNFYIGNVRIDMSTYGAGKKLTYLSATEATWQ